MKKVDFVRVKAQREFVLRKGRIDNFNGAEKIIRDRIENGWEFAGYVPLQFINETQLDTITLVFQKD
ncbi:hypothetical protein AN639_12410 [Candidatus Epulonipiscium fishelsonii]|uniref:Uncharacterized protein n=1 Tax=Candidatus Epulonipiscium fishelsonii TaxID=77094 RepID=A0ACC8XCA5_9FIRM|nr:hypothetical protein AN396_01180 [Epulopiscium sp. SCG-B11WGA-EpuloA1]ONI42456.1 hypothetical protein AN639_12410 [Epulopiscium sp. SCG-B05WGA-EpuloA1]